MTLSVKKVIASDPPDAIGVIPLVCDWGIPRNCLVALRGEDCKQPIAAIYVLDEPIEGHCALGVCAEHHAELYGNQAKGEGC